VKHADEMLKALGVDGRQTGTLWGGFESLHPARKSRFTPWRVVRRVEQPFCLQEPGMALPEAGEVRSPVPAQPQNRAQTSEAIGAPVGQSSPVFSRVARL
jgi:hypothetical protein